MRYAYLHYKTNRDIHMKLTDMLKCAIVYRIHIFFVN